MVIVQPANTTAPFHAMVAKVSSEEQFESDMPMCADSSIHVSLIKIIGTHAVDAVSISASGVA